MFGKVQLYKEDSWLLLNNIRGVRVNEVVENENIIEIFNFVMYEQIVYSLDV